MEDYTAVERHVETMAGVMSCSLAYAEFLKFFRLPTRPKLMYISKDWKTIVFSPQASALEVRTDCDLVLSIDLDDEDHLPFLWSLAFKAPGTEECFKGAIYRYGPRKAETSFALECSTPQWPAHLRDIFFYLLILGLGSAVWFYVLDCEC